MLGTGPRCALCIASCVLVNCLPNGDNSSVEIEIGVRMPLINLGGVHSKPSNYSLWLELGGRGVDTAWAYGNDVQSSVGHAIKTSGISRDALFITTKVPCCPNYWGYACSTWTGKTSDEVVKEAAHADLELLGVSSVDLLLLHNPCLTMESTVAAYRALEVLKASGKARAIGISNFNASQIDALMRSVTVKPAVNQCGFSIGGRKDSALARALGGDLETLRHCQALGITYSAYSPLGGLSGTDVLKDPDVVAVAGAHNKTTAQVALRWVVQQGVVAVTASGKESHDRGDLDIFSFALSEKQMALLSAKGGFFQVLV